MKFKTKDIIARIDQTIAARIKDAERKTKEAEVGLLKNREEWLQNAEHWTTFANRVKDKIRKGRPILHSDIPKEIRGGFRNELKTFHQAKPQKYEANISELEAMKATLEAVTDEEITTTGLKEIGFKNIRNLFS